MCVFFYSEPPLNRCSEDVNDNNSDNIYRGLDAFCGTHLQLLIAEGMHQARPAYFIDRNVSKGRECRTSLTLAVEKVSRKD